MQAVAKRRRGRCFEVNAENVALSVLQRAGNEASCTFQDAKRSCRIDLPWLMSGPRPTSVAQVGGCSPVRGDWLWSGWSRRR